MIQTAVSSRRSLCVAPLDIRLWTSQEASINYHALVDGPSGRNWRHDGEKHLYEHPRHRSHTVEVLPLPGENAADVADLIARQGPDSIFVLCYILTGLLPHLPAAEVHAQWFYLPDVAEACGMVDNRSLSRRLANVARVWDAIQALRRFTVVGTRTLKEGRKTVERRLDSELLWVRERVAFTPEELPQQLTMDDVPPSSVNIVLSTAWRAVLADTEMMQYVSGIRALSTIPGGQPSGRIARAIGLRLLELARVKAPGAALDIKRSIEGKVPQALPVNPRREWIETYGGEIDQRNPARTLKAYDTARRELVQAGVVSPVCEGEVGSGSVPASHRGWFAAWLEEPVRFVPGEVFLPQFQRIASRGGNAADTVDIARIRGRGRPANIPKRTGTARKSGTGFLPYSTS